MLFVSGGTDALRHWALLLQPEAYATLAVLAGLLGAACIVKAPIPVRWVVLGLALLMLVAGALFGRAVTGMKLLEADWAALFGLTLLAVTAGQKRLPSGLARMARAAGAGWASVFFHTVLRPAAWRALACWAIAMVLSATDFGLALRFGLGGHIAQAVALSGCTVLGLALLLGPRPG
jgi:ABC-type spermidine/putrescine transport system permease subunit II